MSLITVEPCIYRLKCGALYVKVHRAGINHAGGTHTDLHTARQAREKLLCQHPPGRAGRPRKVLWHHPIHSSQP